MCMCSLDVVSPAPDYIYVFLHWSEKSRAVVVVAIMWRLSYSKCTGHCFVCRWVSL